MEKETLMKELQDIDINYLDSKKVVRTIKFNPDWDNQTDEYKLEYLLALASSMNHAADVAYKEKFEAVEKMNKVLELNESAAQNANISQMLMSQSITESNAEKQDLFKRIAELKKEIREKDHIIRQLELQVGETS